MMDKEKPETGMESSTVPQTQKPPLEKGGFADLGLLEPTRYGDWDVKGRCSDF